MEYFLCRAMEVCRLSDEQLQKLQTFEKSENVMKGFDARTQTYKEIRSRERRCLYPDEIQQVFGLGPLKEHYEIPTDNDSAQSAHNQRLRAEFRVSGLIPMGGDFNVTDLDGIHAFDETVRQANSEMKINLQFELSTGRRRRAADEL